MLEIGCGEWSFSKKIVRQKFGYWIGLDKVKTSLTTCVGSAYSLPFKDGFFDFIVASQVMEHLPVSENGPRRFISEAVRVLKKRGMLLINVPIYLHGQLPFALGHIVEIISFFDGSPFSRMDITYYRKDYCDLAPARAGIDYAQGWITNKYKYVSDRDTLRRLSVNQQQKLQVLSSQDYRLKNAFVMAFRCIKN